MGNKTLSDKEMVTAINEFCKGDTVPFINKTLPLTAGKNITTIAYNSSEDAYLLIDTNGKIHIREEPVGKQITDILQMAFNTEAKLRKYDLTGNFNKRFEIIAPKDNTTETYSIFLEATQKSGNKWVKLK